MAVPAARAVADVCRAFGNRPDRLLDIVRGLATDSGCLEDGTIGEVATRLGVRRVDVESLVSFYSFLSRTPKAKVVIRLCDDIIDRMQGYERIKQVFEEELGVQLGETTPDGRFTLEALPGEAHLQVYPPDGSGLPPASERFTASGSQVPPQSPATSRALPIQASSG